MSAEGGVVQTVGNVVREGSGAVLTTGTPLSWSIACSFERR